MWCIVPGASFVTPGFYRPVDNCNQVRRFPPGGSISPAHPGGNVRKSELRCSRRSSLRDHRVMYGARERRQVSVRPFVRLVYRFTYARPPLPVARRPEILVDRAPVRTDSPTTSAIKESMSEPCESHGLAHCCRNDLFGSPLPLPAFQTILSTDEPFSISLKSNDSIVEIYNDDYSFHYQRVFFYLFSIISRSRL